MRKAFIKRTKTGDHGTFGTLVTDSGFTCATLELPWRENKTNESCIPPGKYFCVFRSSSKFGACYEVLRVAGRTDIMIHCGNFAGDKKRGLRSDSLGCILLGSKIAELQGQRAVLDSRGALKDLLHDLGRLNFDLEIVDAFA